MDYKKELLERINKLIGKEISVPEFENQYYLYFLNEVPNDALNDDDNELFAEIQEKLDWVSENLSEEERKDGWINQDEYIEWLKNKITDYKIL
jgi:hypothetical protein